MSCSSLSAEHCLEAVSEGRCSVVNGFLSILLSRSLPDDLQALASWFPSWPARPLLVNLVPFIFASGVCLSGTPI
jgi:hypothetical protein